MKTDPLLLDIPEEFTTQRLIIRAPRAGESAEVNAAIRESIDQLRPWMPWATPTPTVEQTESHSRQAYAKFLAREDLPLRFFLKDGGAFVGSSGLHRIDWDVPRFEIGYWVRTSLCGRGYVSEAVNGIARFAFEILKANRVEIRCDERNERSWRVAERCGFALEGTLRHDCRDTEGKLRNTCVYSKITPTGSAT